MQYESLDEIRAVVRSFEECAVERGEWGHPEHLVVAYHYSLNHDFETAYEKMKTGILNLLSAFGIDTSAEMPYHETMTVFWMKTIYGYAKENPQMSVDVIDEMIARFDKYYPGRFYSRELLMSDRARTEYVEPDLVKMDN